MKKAEKQQQHGVVLLSLFSFFCPVQRPSVHLLLEARRISRRRGVELRIISIGWFTIAVGMFSATRARQTSGQGKRAISARQCHGRLFIVDPISYAPYENNHRQLFFYFLSRCCAGWKEKCTRIHKCIRVYSCVYLRVVSQKPRPPPLQHMRYTFEKAFKYCEASYVTCSRVYFIPFASFVHDYDTGKIK